MSDIKIQLKKIINFTKLTKFPIFTIFKFYKSKNKVKVVKNNYKNKNS